MMPLKPWPWNTLPEPRPADWGIGMTVCIASYCSREKALLLASDTLISTHDMSAEMAAFKFERLSEHWMAQYAGNDVGEVTPILKMVEGELQQEGDDPLGGVVNAFTRAFAHQRKVRAETEIIRPLGYDSVTDFLAAGQRDLGTDLFTRAVVEMQQLRVDVQFLVAGFHNGKSPEIFTVSDPGRVSYYSEVGLWAIGSGQTNALGSFFNLRSPAKFCDISTCLYRVCEAKFNAENAMGVGKETSVFIWYQDGKQVHISFQQVHELRNFWEATRANSLPSGAKEKAAELIEAASRRKEERARQLAAQTSEGQQ